MTIKIKKKTISQAIAFIMFSLLMVFLLTRTDLASLLDDIAKQAWIFFGMLFLRFGEENIWRPTMISIARDENDIIPIIGEDKKKSNNS